MLTVVLVINGLITLLCLFIAWQVWKISRVLGQVADTLIEVEQNTYNVLNPAPKVIMQGQKGMQQLRRQYRQLEPQLQKVERALALLGMGQLLWNRRSLVSQQFKSTKKRRI